MNTLLIISEGDTLLICKTQGYRCLSIDNDPLQNSHTLCICAIAHFFHLSPLSVSSLCVLCDVCVCVLCGIMMLCCSDLLVQKSGFVVADRRPESCGKKIALLLCFQLSFLPIGGFLSRNVKFNCYQHLFKFSFSPEFILGCVFCWTITDSIILNDSESLNAQFKDPITIYTIQGYLYSNFHSAYCFKAVSLKMLVSMIVGRYFFCYLSLGD